ncbi:MAG: endonuclease MutS2 [Lachnospiraceae bacterium]|nr:endonuclease MutS2 [Lachnospiraceae bacterium]
MNQKSLKILEYDKIIKMLTSYAGSAMGKKLCEELTPTSDLNTILSMQEETNSALLRIYRQGNLSFLGVEDVKPSLLRLNMGASLNTSELLSVAKLLSCVQTAISYCKIDDRTEFADALTYLFESLTPLTHLYQDITRCILSPEEIADDASPALKDIRRNIKSINAKVHQQLTGLIASSKNQSMLQDSLVTMRNGRYCVPVKAEYKNQFQGLIHDQSSTGSTLFIEPMGVVTLNNELRDLEGKEQNEIERILSLLSEKVSLEQESIKRNLEILTKLDFIFARAQLAKSYDGVMPEYNKEGIIRIKRGRHPLLDKKTVVPINIELGDTFSMLLITGPNTGGKTVSLKTAGLFSLMGQSGLFLPAMEGTTLCVFDDVFADIGDEQSIEQSLSTFSSHMTNIVSILNQATEHSLLLFDELGGGTDPTEGAALAISILSHLHSQNIRTIATTHYSELKLFALSTEGIENACCEFDIESLRPTYRLLIGIPGKSNAFAISSKLGLPSYIIEAAKGQIDQSAQDFEALLSDLEQSKITIQKEEEEILAYKEELELLRADLKQSKEDLNNKKASIIREAKEEALSILSEAKEVADESIKKYQQWVQNPKAANAKTMEAQRGKLRDQMNKSSKDLLEQKKRKKGAHSASDFKIGDKVHVFSLSMDGIVQSLPDNKGNISVQMGILRSFVSIEDCEILDEAVITTPTIKRTSKGKVSMNKSSTIRPEINVLGKTVDEAIAVLDKYLDDAYLSHLPQVTIIHGKGTGALRTGIQNYLKKLKYVKSYRAGSFGEGEMGVTIVEFK